MCKHLNAHPYEISYYGQALLVAICCNKCKGTKKDCLFLYLVDLGSPKHVVTYWHIHIESLIFLMDRYIIKVLYYA